MLQALLPQVVECGDQVEVWVLDNASTDETNAVIDESRQLGSFQAIRNVENLGPLKNIIKGPAELATGEYVWVLGDHNLIMPGALKRLIDVVASQRELDLFYLNFRCAVYPGHWPDSAHSGFDGPFADVAKPDLSDSIVHRWNHLINADSGLCTQVYAHVVRARIWKDYWSVRPIGEPYTSGETTYPHTWMIAATCFAKPAGCVSEPVITIFNGAQSWNNPDTQRRVFLLGLPELIRFFAALGLPSVRLLESRRFNQQCVYVGFMERFCAVGRDSTRVAITSLWLAGFRSAFLWKPIITAYFDSRSSLSSQAYWCIRERVHHLREYVFRNSRPARWLRGRLNP